MKKNLKKGQTLIEISIVFGIASIVIISLVMLASSALRQAQESVRRVTASKLATAGIEAVVFYKNVNGFTPDLFTNSGTKCAQIAPTGDALNTDAGCSFITVTTNDNLVYGRKISIAYSGSANSYIVTSEVNWTAPGGVIDSIKISRVLTNYDY